VQGGLAPALSILAHREVPPGPSFLHWQGMTTWNRYLKPTTVEEALRDLHEASGDARVIAGGTDLLLDIQQGRMSPVDTLVDVTGIEELCELREEGETLVVGAALTHARIIADPLTMRNAPCLVEACALIGGPQVRNVATLGGNVAHGLPAADGTIALLALGAQAIVAGRAGRREVPVEDLFAGPGRTTLEPQRSILVGFRIRCRGPREGSAFYRVMRPQGVAIAILNMAVWLRLDARGTVGSARLVVGPGGPTPHRATKAEAQLCGQAAEGLALDAVLGALEEETRLRSSAHRATSEYRHHLLGVLLRRVLPQALASARGAETTAGWPEAREGGE
jgi:CO/xanthine dehydrogenase FAD-binding subunit